LYFGNQIKEDKMVCGTYIGRRQVHTGFLKRHEGNRPLGRHGRRWEYDAITHLKEQDGRMWTGG